MRDVSAAGAKRRDELQQVVHINGTVPVEVIGGARLGIVGDDGQQIIDVDASIHVEVGGTFGHAYDLEALDSVTHVDPTAGQFGHLRAVVVPAAGAELNRI